MSAVPVDLIVIGAGPAGLAAAIAAKKAGVTDLIVLEREDEAGGILNQCIHNGFGLHRFKEELTGPEYAQRDIRMARELGIQVFTGTAVLSVNRAREVVAVSRERGILVYQAKAVILAMGCRERPRGALAIPGSRPAGILSAGTAQKMVNMAGIMPGRRVVILGSGDIGLIMARRMTLQGAEVLACVELMPYSSGLTRNIVQCLHDYDIPLLLSHTVTDIRGKERLTGVTVAKVGEDRLPIPGTEIQYECDTLLLSVGLIPENELSREAGVRIADDTQGPIVSDTFMTSVPGVFACGNVLHVHDLVDYVSRESAQAGETAAAFIRGGRAPFERVRVRQGSGVRQAVPQLLDIPREGAAAAVTMLFRPDQVYRGHYVNMRAGEDVLYSQRRMILTPGEMAEAKLTPAMLEKLRGRELRIDITPEKPEREASS